MPSLAKQKVLYRARRVGKTVGLNFPKRHPTRRPTFEKDESARPQIPNIYSLIYFIIQELYQIQIPVAEQLTPKNHHTLVGGVW